jgi:hypothetical protein
MKDEGHLCLGNIMYERESGYLHVFVDILIPV